MFRLNSEWYLPKLAPDIAVDKNGEIFELLRNLQIFAYFMVRYASSHIPKDHKSHDSYTGKDLINPKTNKHFTIDYLVNNKTLVLSPENLDKLKNGSTAGIEGREYIVALVTIALYKELYLN